MTEDTNFCLAVTALPFTKHLSLLWKYLWWKLSTKDWNCSQSMAIFQCLPGMILSWLLIILNGLSVFDSRPMSNKQLHPLKTFLKMIQKGLYFISHMSLLQLVKLWLGYSGLICWVNLLTFCKKLVNKTVTSMSDSW